MLHSKFLLCFLLFVIIHSLPAHSQQNTYQLPNSAEALAEGEHLFAKNCAMCHEFCKQMIGPSLASVTDRRPIPWLIAFIKNSPAVIRSGDEYAQYLYRQYDNKHMPEYDDQLTENQILNILSYIHLQSRPEYDSTLKYYMIAQPAIEDMPDHTAPNYYDMPYEEEIPTDMQSILNGKELFAAQCAECHEFCTRLKGPALASVTDRRPLPWLVEFIKNPTEMFQSGDAYTRFLRGHFKEMMPSHEFLETEQILDILAFVQDSSSAPTHIAGAVSDAYHSEGGDELLMPIDALGQDDGTTDMPTSEATDYTTMQIIIFVVVGLFTVALTYIIIQRLLRIRRRD
jgi:cytochrome c2